MVLWTLEVDMRRVYKVKFSTAPFVRMVIISSVGLWFIVPTMLIVDSIILLLK